MRSLLLEKTLRQIGEADQVAISVKFDEHTITQVSISAPGKMLEGTVSASSHSPTLAEAIDNTLASLQPVVSPAWGRGLRSTIALVATGVVVGAAWSYCVGFHAELSRLGR